MPNSDEIKVEEDLTNLNTKVIELPLRAVEKLAEHFGSYRTLAAFPIIKDKEVLEAVTLYSISLDEYTAEHQRLLEEAVALLATMLSALSDAGEGNRAGADLGSIDIEAAAMDSELAH